MLAGSLVPKHILNHPELNDADKLIFGIIFQFAINDREAYMRNSVLAETMGKSVRAIQVSLSKMKKHGLIDISNNGKGRVISISLSVKQSFDTNSGVKESSRGGEANVMGGVKNSSWGGEANVTHKIETNIETKKETKKESESVSSKDNSNQELIYPKSLDTPECRKAFETWFQYKTEIKKPYKTHIGKQACINAWSDQGAKATIAAIEYSMGNEWTGIHPKRENQPESPTRHPKELEAERRLQAQNNQVKRQAEKRSRTISREPSINPMIGDIAKQLGVSNGLERSQRGRRPEGGSDDGALRHGSNNGAGQQGESDSPHKKLRESNADSEGAQGKGNVEPRVQEDTRAFGEEF